MVDHRCTHKRVVELGMILAVSYSLTDGGGWLAVTCLEDEALVHTYPIAL